MPDLATLGLFAVACLALTAMPGPDMLLIASRSLSQGRWSGFATLAGIQLGTPLAYTLVIGGVLTSLLTLLAVARVWNRAFWRKPEDAEHPHPVLLADAMDSPAGLRTGKRGLILLPRTMVGSTLGLVVLGVALTVFAGPLFRVAGQSADAMLDRSAYIHAVLGQQAPVPNLALNGSIDSEPDGSAPGGGGK